MRELRNMIERGALIGKGTVIELCDLGLEEAAARRNGKPQADDRCFPEIPPEGLDLTTIQEAIEKRYIEEALLRTGGNESKAAVLLNINHHTFRYRRKKLRAGPSL